MAFYALLNDDYKNKLKLISYKEKGKENMTEAIKFLVDDYEEKNK